jgi:hypothetical protein
MKLIITEQQLKSIVKEQGMGWDYTSKTEWERYLEISDDKYHETYLHATNQGPGDLPKGKAVMIPCYFYDNDKGNYHEDKNCKKILNYSSSDTLAIYKNGRVTVNDKTTGKMKKKGTLNLLDNDHIRIDWDGGGSLEKKRDYNKLSKIDSPKNSDTICATSLDQLKKGSGKVLQKGCKSETVKELQKMLGMEQKYHTGFFGDITKAKVIEYQKTHKDVNGVKLVQDGIVGEKTYNSLKSNK